jgi:hypothetical protein
MTVSIEIVRTVVDGAMGEIAVTYHNTGGAAVADVRITVSDGGPVSANATGHLLYLPGTSDGGYLVASVAAGGSVSKSFAVKSVDAEAGKTFQANAQVSLVSGDETASAEIFVEARPEVYAAIGAAETLRAQLLDFYNNAKQKGREIHEDTALPESKGDPAARALQATSFQWALQMVEAGTKLFRVSGPPRGSGPAEQD